MLAVKTPYASCGSVALIHRKEYMGIKKDLMIYLSKHGRSSFSRNERTRSWGRGAISFTMGTKDKKSPCAGVTANCGLNVKSASNEHANAALFWHLTLECGLFSSQTMADWFLKLMESFFPHLCASSPPFNALTCKNDTRLNVPHRCQKGWGLYPSCRDVCSRLA